MGSSSPRLGTIREPEEPEENAGRCKRCGRETETEDGLCGECRWEIQVGMKPPVQDEKKKHFWSGPER